MYSAPPHRRASARDDLQRGEGRANAISAGGRSIRKVGTDRGARKQRLLYRKPAFRREVMGIGFPQKKGGELAQRGNVQWAENIVQQAVDAMGQPPSFEAGVVDPALTRPEQFQRQAWFRFWEEGLGNAPATFRNPCWVALSSMDPASGITEVGGGTARPPCGAGRRGGPGRCYSGLFELGSGRCIR